MKQSATERPDPSTQRKAAIAHGAALDHTGKVRVNPIPGFDLGHTIFKTLEGRFTRFLVASRVGKEVHWDAASAQAVQLEYEAARAAHPLPMVSPELLEFLVRECDFDVEHADGSFLDHLYFCFEYSVQHYPAQSPLVMLLHSILGTATNTFAMSADKIPALRKLVAPSEWAQIEAFPSVLRLLYAGSLRRKLRENIHRADALASITFHRVIDNEPITMSGEQLWVALNYQLIHLVDFLPVGNWSVYQNDPMFTLFEDLYGLLGQAGKREASVAYTPVAKRRKLEGELQSLGGWLTTLIPAKAAEQAAAKSVNRFSERIGHSLDYQIAWA